MTLRGHPARRRPSRGARPRARTHDVSVDAPTSRRGTALVTGASGFLGSRLVDGWAADDDDRLHDASASEPSRRGVVWRSATSRSRSRFASCSRRCGRRVVFHLASHVSGVRDPENVPLDPGREPRRRRERLLAALAADSRRVVLGGIVRGAGAGRRAEVAVRRSQGRRDCIRAHVLGALRALDRRPAAGDDLRRRAAGHREAHPVRHPLLPRRRGTRARERPSSVDCGSTSTTSSTHSCSPVRAGFDRRGDRHRLGRAPHDRRDRRHPGCADGRDDALPPSVSPTLVDQDRSRQTRDAAVAGGSSHALDDLDDLDIRFASTRSSAEDLYAPRLRGFSGQARRSRATTVALADRARRASPATRSRTRGRPSARRLLPPARTACEIR